MSPDLKFEWWRAHGAIGFAPFLLVTMMLLLCGCWEVGAPLIGVGAVGGGVAIASTRGGNKPDSTPTATPQDGAPGAQSTNSPLADLSGVPVAAGLPTSTQPVHPSSSAAILKSPRSTPREPRRAKVVAESSEPKHNNPDPVAIVSPLSAPTDDLPATVIVH
jgi:hypothetical protein